VIAGNIAEGEVFLVRVPDRPFGELEARAETLESHVIADDGRESAIADLYVHFL